MTETTDPQPTQATVTVASQSIELLLTGKPDVRYKWGSGSIRPSLVVFTYRQEGIHAHLYGVWVREDGELTEDPCDQEYRIGGPDDWPDWLADLARKHAPAAVPSAPADRAALLQRITKAVQGVLPMSSSLACDVAADAVLAVLPASAEQDVTRVIELYERWTKAGPPPLGTLMSRWWDARLVELRDAIVPPIDEQPAVGAQQPKEA